MTVNGRMLGRFSKSMNSPIEAGPFETRLESDDSDWTMTDNRSRTLKTTFDVIEFVRKKIVFLPALVVCRPNRPYTPCALVDTPWQQLQFKCLNDTKHKKTQ